VLEPLRVEHAREMAPVLGDARLHEYIGGRPLTEAGLRARYERLVAGESPDGSAGWLNWVVRERSGGAAVGTMQATLTAEHAEIAWVVGSAHQGRGVASEAAAGVADWLRELGAVLLVAHIHPDHEASAGVARRLGMQMTETVVDGERRWELAFPSI
jgi:RimJ/RimL family protein N-acetyltransferase